MAKVLSRAGGTAIYLLEKEALVKGVSLGQTLEIDIPPPRPKRKPSYPYPRKSYAGCSTPSSGEVKDGKLLTSASSLYAGKELPELKNEPPSQKPAGTENSASENETRDEENCSEVTALFHEASCVSIPSANKSTIPTSAVLKNSCTLREFVPLTKETTQNKERVMMDEFLKVEAKGNQKLDRTDPNVSDVDNNSMSEALNLKNSCHNSHEKLVIENNTDKLKQREKLSLLSTDEIQANQSYPRHVPVHVVDVSSGTCVQTQPPDIYPSSNIYHLGTHGNPCLFTNPTASVTTEHNSNTSMSSVHQTLPNFPLPFTPLHNQETYRSIHNISSTFPSLLMSALLQNPAAHMAASLAASFWPCTNGETSVDSSAGPPGGFPLRQMSATPNLAAIAAATVAAASAWWAAHGMLPLCPPIHTGFSYPPPPTAATPMDIGQAPAVNNNERQDDIPKDPPWEVQQLDPELSEATKPQNPASKCPTLSSSDSAESGGARSNCTKPKSPESEQNPAPVTGVHDPNKSKVQKKVDRSSCGSNTPSSSEVETDALEEDENDKEESKEPDLSHQTGEPNNRRCRSTNNLNEAWKEVSEEGRLAFRALFTREVLPQSFSPPHDTKNTLQQPENIIIDGKQNSVEKDDEDMLRLNLSCNSWGVNPNQPGLLCSKNEEKDLLSVNLGQGKFKARRTGFKPYKRCSVEAKESRMTNGSGQCEEKGPKRIRLEGEAST
ncbi:hypothetical protein BVC80_237g15 [Macleaya cordata]|uniref:Protein LHY n=1 Tax=Macleaya cordata TaxID=56857 RepID=A0A200RB31_MACCD|nr:hypothetical protein BVC80_237g15 [Macleaya cordata]